MSVSTSATLPDVLGQPARDFLAEETRHLMVIGDERTPAADGRTFATLDPATGAEIAHMPLAGAADVDRAVATAREQLERGPWSTQVTPAERARLIHALADALERNAEEFAQLESLDNGKPVKL